MHHFVDRMQSMEMLDQTLCARSTRGVLKEESGHVLQRLADMATEDGAGRASSDHRLLLLQEMRTQNFDMIRFASYRTACKLRFVQKKANRKLDSLCCL
jgi:hypothetical protein